MLYTAIVSRQLLNVYYKFILHRFVHIIQFSPGHDTPIFFAHSKLEENSFSYYEKYQKELSSNKSEGYFLFKILYDVKGYIMNEYFLIIKVNH